MDGAAAGPRRGQGLLAALARQAYPAESAPHALQGAPGLLELPR